jgi:hypothetical protein
MECKLQIFRGDDERVCGRTYRFAVVDYSKSKSYPANFVCMLPIKVDNRKSKIVNAEIKAEIERRLNLIDPNQVHLVKCSRCKKTFQPRKMRKYKRNFCDDCLKARYSLRAIQ